MIARRLLTVMTTLWLGLLPSGVCAGQEAFFDEGNQRYQDGDFDGAVASYARILEAGLESGDLYYNLGNTYFKRGELGPAILYYERARRLMPADDDLLANLALARQLTADDITPLPQFWLFRAVRWWVDLVPRSALAWLVGLAYLVAAGGVIVWILKPGTPMALWARRGAAASAGMALLFGINLTVRELGIGTPQIAVVMATEADVQSAPSGDSALRIFAVHEGATVRMGRRSDDWVEIVLEDGTVGWVEAAQLEPI
ncbi:MAG: tetratricopeptide repeat protein [Ilumatobacter sp.]|nr:tetratricopeptide repeat protein [Ilumatobacter sp.]